MASENERVKYFALTSISQTVASCYSGVVELFECAADAFASHADRFTVAYHPWPSIPADDPGCMVVFVHNDELWSTIVFFNDASLENAESLGKCRPPEYGPDF
jgi:hypothetical protein